MLALLLMAVSGWSAASRPALAHEFKLALVTPAAETAGPVNGTDVRDGFRLAVDQSPDVSHAPGTEAGDHLGGVDVDISLIDGSAPATASRAVERQLTAGLTAVVVIAPAAITRAVAAELEGTSALLLVGHASGDGPEAIGHALRLAQNDRWAAGSSRAERFVAQFERAYGRAPSSSAALGYDAGRLLDAAVADASDGVEDLESVVAAATGRSDVLVSSELREVPGLSSGPDTAPPAETRDESVSGELLLLGAAAVLLAVLGARQVLARRSRPTGDRPC